MSDSFIYRGDELRYFDHPHNDTRQNERRVEIPIIQNELAIQAHRDVCRILEVGNVLRQYFPDKLHEVIDKYDPAEHVERIDVVDLIPDPRGYDVIVSVSTIEHIGLDETDLDPEKPMRAIRRLQACLHPTGLLIFTVPLGYNHHLDAHIRALSEVSVHYLKRYSSDNEWAEVPRGAVEGARYMHPFPFANALAICYLSASLGSGHASLQAP